MDTTKDAMKYAMNWRVGVVRAGEVVLVSTRSPPGDDEVQMDRVVVQRSVVDEVVIVSA